MYYFFLFLIYLSERSLIEGDRCSSNLESQKSTSPKETHRDEQVKKPKRKELAHADPKKALIYKEHQNHDDMKTKISRKSNLPGKLN